MFVGGLILAATLISFAVWLQWNEREGWPGETYQRDDSVYLQARLRSRRRIHWIIGMCGGLILVATLATPQKRQIWIACWTTVMIALITVVFLALLDAFRTHRYHQAKLPEIRRQILGNTDVSDGNSGDEAE